MQKKAMTITHSVLSVRKLGIRVRGNLQISPTHSQEFLIILRRKLDFLQSGIIENYSVFDSKSSPQG